MTTPRKLKNGRWSIRPAYKDPLTGKWTQTQKTFNSKTEALEFDRKILYEADNGYTSKNTSIGAYFDHWMETYKKPYLKHRSIRRITYDFDHIFDYFGRQKKLADITKPIWQTFMNDLSKKYAKETNRLTNGDFRAMCEVAIDEGVITRNPTRSAKYSGKKLDLKHERQLVLSLNDFKKVVHAIESSEDSVSKYVCLVHAFTGMRFGEVIGLTWDKVNIFAKTIRVSEQYDYDDAHKLTGLKGDSPERTINVPDALINHLRNYKTWYKDQIRRGNIIENVDRLIFNSVTGHPVSNSGINDYIHGICTQVGIVRITTHGFRRTQATLMTLANNDLRSVATYLGHQDSKTTLKYYIKSIPELEEQAHKKMMTFYEDEKII
ncbi:hypothetical protein FC70_GL000506 [Paucilactobacillus oligofermentans DSM 15707 = LMG 22743]|uniref:Tyr recombinase domain-containing protein n=1 Tax=Paucilactobacillus oligofermentans DSM 15707 = LMG 22743 TaxID=1423778 RepID=A0A0R1RHC2_9LACO|nr:site-specific integrase [Paucilactobacillus oligofermentans]KRL55921.1 hypothetical protein FC70_GL000506 [Paucilactobacillus oligofermentans DSM 15707 = LMG 22743]CUS26098.1 Phage integrase [Paucilactobacillus oligofermentans DSM 15707 = LMG 22743]